jgi:hypothetical protein
MARRRLSNGVTEQGSLFSVGPGPDQGAVVFCHRGCQVPDEASYEERRHSCRSAESGACDQSVLTRSGSCIVI